jgi:nicotinate-nucleotide adenylyltransferase
VRLGLFGGTFDPPHIGHLIAAQDAWLALRLDRVHFIPAARPPHKSSHSISPAELRVELIEAAIRGDDRFALDDVELTRTGPSFTVDTLRDYAARYAGAELFLLIGADQWAEFETWREPDEIRRLARVAVLTREGADPKAAAVEVVPVTRIDVTSTEIRRRAAEKLPFRYLVPLAVADLIEKHGLYLPARQENAV